MAYQITVTNKLRPNDPKTRIPLVFSTRQEAQDEADKQQNDPVTGARFTYAVEEIKA